MKNRDLKKPSFSVITFNMTLAISTHSRQSMGSHISSEFCQNAGAYATYFRSWFWYTKL